VALHADAVPWLRIKLLASSHDAELVADALTAVGATAVSIESASEEPRLQGVHETIPLWAANRVTGLFADDANVTDVVANVRKAVDRDDLPFEFDRLNDSDWAHSWREHVRPLAIAENLWVVPSWHSPPNPSATNVILDPGLAFGTGTHPTTQLCLAWLASQPLMDCTVIDYGCGSGILAIAALKLGASRAIAVDVDPIALEVSRENAARNGVLDRLVTCLPDALAPGRAAPIVLANILSETLIALAPELTGRLEPGGRLALSGVLETQADEVATAYAHAMTLASAKRDEWILLTGTRKQ